VINFSDSNYEKRHLLLRNNKGCGNHQSNTVDCLASKLHSLVAARLNCTVTGENVDWNTWNTCWRRDMSTTTAQNGSRAADSHNGTKTYFYVYIDQCSNV